jgi:hypothetical protein
MVDMRIRLPFTTSQEILMIVMLSINRSTIILCKTWICLKILTGLWKFEMRTFMAFTDAQTLWTHWPICLNIIHGIQIQGKSTLLTWYFNEILCMSYSNCFVVCFLPRIIGLF